MVPAVNQQRRQALPWQQWSSPSPLTASVELVRDFIFSTERRRHLLMLSLHHHVIICCLYDPLAHPLTTGGSKCKLKKKMRHCRVDGKMISFSPPEINPCQLRLLGSTCQELVTFSPPSDPNFGCLSCSINDLELPHSLLLYLG